MARFKVVCSDGRQGEVEAQRVCADQYRMAFQVRSGGAWHRSAEYAVGEVEDVRKRIVELNGNVRWVTARPLRLEL